MGTKKRDDTTRKTGPGQPDDDKRVTRSTNLKIGRDAGTGQFIPVKQAQKRPSTSVVETIKRPASPAKKPKK